MTKDEKTKCDEIRDWIRNCDINNPHHQKALHRGLLIVYRNQTPQERAWQATVKHNQKGFNSRDASFGSWIAERALEVEAGVSPYPSLSPKMYSALVRILPKYARQILIHRQQSKTANQT